MAVSNLNVRDNSSLNLGVNPHVNVKLIDMKKRASQKGRNPFKRNVKNITKDLKQVDLEDSIKEVEKESIILEKGVLNFHWVAREYNISVDEAKELVKKANK